MANNNLPQGYKQTELGVIPEDWEIKTLGELGSFSKGSGISRAEANTGSIPCVRYGEIYTHHNDYIKKYNSFISSEVAQKAKLLHYGDILFAGSGETKEDIGKSIAFIENIQAYAGGDIIILSTDTNICDAKFIGYISNTSFVNKQKATKGQGDAVVHITSDSLKNISILLPPLPEQKAIAEALSDVDDLITALDKKIAKKRLIKQGAMQELLTGKKRLPGFKEEWEEKTIEDLGELTGSGVDKKFKEDEHFVRLVNYLDVFRRDYIYDKELDFWTTANNLKKEQCNVLQGDVFFTPSSEMPFDIAISAVAMNDMKDVCYSYHIYRLRFHIDIDLCFKAYMFKSQFFYDQANVACEGSGKRYVISLSKFKKLKVYYPTNIQEQQAIATILSNMDKEIAELEAQRDKYRLVKSGMMQKLLTGEIRLKKPQASQILESKAIPVDAHIIAGHIVNRLYKSEGWGRTKLQKSLHLAGYYAQIYIGNEYIRNTAGPDDQRLMNYIDQQFRQFNHVKITRVKLNNGKIHYNYTPTSLIQEVEMAYEKYPENVRKQIDILLDKMNVMDLDCAEILSTLYGVWNNRIIKSERITDDLLIADFYAWSKHKLEFDESRLRKALVYMREENIVPIGWGKYIDKKN